MEFRLAAAFGIGLAPYLILSLGIASPVFAEYETAQLANDTAENAASLLQHNYETDVLSQLHDSNLRTASVAARARQQTQSPAVRAFAQEVYRDRRALDKKVVSLAARDGVSLSAPSADPDGRQIAAATDGLSFDAEFLGQVKAGAQRDADGARAAVANLRGTRAGQLLSEALAGLENNAKAADRFQLQAE
jgi:hypothetical protein